MNYDLTKHKIRILYNKIEEKYTEYDKLKKEIIERKSINYIKKQAEYVLEDTIGEPVYTLELLLKNFPKKILPYLKINYIYYPLEAYDECFDDYDFNIFTYEYFKTILNESTDEIIYMLQINFGFLGALPDDVPVSTIRLKIKLFIDYPKYYDELRTRKT